MERGRGGRGDSLNGLSRKILAVARDSAINRRVKGKEKKGRERGGEICRGMGERRGRRKWKIEEFSALSGRIWYAEGKRNKEEIPRQSGEFNRGERN